MANYEIEIKSLIGDKKKAGELVSKMKLADPDLIFQGSHSQLNHYFVSGDLNRLAGMVVPYLPEAKAQELKIVVAAAKDFSVRTREADEKVILVIKLTVDDTTSFNGTARQEFEAPVEQLSLDELDDLILKCGFKYQAKWSRQRQDYKYKNLNVSIDKNAGYGYLAEFERVIGDQAKAGETKAFIRSQMAELGVSELPQDRLARMFDYYNKHWQDYYGTEKTFNIE